MRNLYDPRRTVSLAVHVCLALAALLLAAPGSAQSTQRERSSLPASVLPPARILAELRSGGYVIYFRHAATDFTRDDSKMKSYEDCPSQRNLVERGRADARAIGAALRELRIPVGRVLASPFCRTIETAQLVFGHAEKTQEARGGPPAPDSERYAPLRRILSTPGTAGANLAVVSHGNPFHSVAGPPYLAEGEAAVVRPLGGDFQVIARIRVEDWERLKRAAND